MLKSNLDESNVDRIFKRIMSTKSSLVPKEILLNDLYSNYKDNIIGDITLNKKKSRLERKKVKSKPKNKKQSNIKGVYYNSLRNLYSVLLHVDGPNQQHFGYFKTLEKAEKRCLEIKQQYGLK